LAVISVRSTTSCKLLGEHLLGNIIRRPPLQGLDRDLLAAFGRHQDDRQHRVFLADFGHEFQPVHLRHLHVGQNEVRQVQLDLMESLHPVVGVMHFPIGMFLQQTAGEFTIDRGIIDYENSRHNSFSGDAPHRCALEMMPPGSITGNFPAWPN
jgi:hypothetical protein